MSNLSTQISPPEEVTYKLRDDVIDDENSHSASFASVDIHRWNVVHRWRGRKLRFWITVLACVSFCFFGYDQGMTAGVNASNHYVKLMGYGYIDEKNEPQVTNGLLEGGIVAIYYFGTLIGCFLGGWAGDKYGRIKGIAFGAAFAIIGAGLQCSALNVSWMLIARIVNGVGTGILNSVVPVWATEVADHSSRGQMISIEFTSNIFGVVIAYWLAYGLSFVDNGNAQIRWRFPIAFQILPLAILLSIVWFFPESPRWLAKEHKDEEARYVLAALRGGDWASTQEEFKEIVAAVRAEKRFMETNGPTNYMSMIFGTGKGGMHITRRTYLIIWLQVIQEWVGVAGVTVYAPVMFRAAGFSAQMANLIAGCNNITYCLSTLIPVFILDKYGRRKILYVGAVLQAIAMAAAGGLSKASEDGGRPAYGQGATACLFIFTFVFGASWLCIPWVYQTEIFPLEVRVKGSAFGVVGWSIGNGWLTLLCPIMFQSIGPWTLVVFAACSLSTLPMVYCLYPETNQRKLEDIEYLFNIKSPWNWDAERNYACHMADKAANIAMELSEDGKGITMDDIFEVPSKQD
ncbi:putative MFS monosaccharide transporter [Trichophaea hybrida]|nr:putative MFS monosaccharide transporter [Trichophaea hybrida]